MRLLYLEDECTLARLVGRALERAGFVVDLASSAVAARTALRDVPYDLMILDRSVPDGDGLEVMRTARRAGSMVPVILATAQDKVAARVEALDAGADDYVVKPFATAELLARIRAVLRRPALLAEQSYRAGNVTVGAADRSITVGGMPVVLSRREAVLLEKLVRRAGQVVTRMHIQSALFGFDEDASGNALEASICRLRKWLAMVGADRQVHTVRGVGYILAP